MSQYLRDKIFKNLDLKEEAIKELNQELLRIRDKENEGIKDNNSIKFIQLSYIIRFDRKGFLLYKFDEAMEYFRSAKTVERFVFYLKSIEHSQTSRAKGKSVDISFDALNLNNCFIIVQDDDQGWVNSTFLRIEEIINKFSNINYLARNAWVNFAIQILGVILALLLSLWAAFNFSSKNVPYSFGLVFITAFLLLSNIWTYIYSLCLRMVDFFWPNILFKERKGIYNIVKLLVSGIFVTLCIGIIGWTLKGIGCFVLSIFKVSK